MPFNSHTLIINDGQSDYLHISLDYDTLPDNPDDWHAVFLYVPYKPEKEHEHIELNREQAEKLRDWLTDWLSGKFQ